VWAFGFLEDFVKREGRTMEAEVLRTGGGLSGVTAADLVGCSSFWLGVGTRIKVNTAQKCC
jgi:hypothetical protein